MTKHTSDIIAQLAAAMAATDASRYRLSQDTGISQGTLSELASGTRGMTVENCERLAAAMGFRFQLIPVAK